MRKHFLLIALICTIFVACGPKPELPTVTTNSVSDVTDTTALCVGAVVDNGNADITAKGFCWSTEQNPTLEDNTVAAIVTREDAADDFFTATLLGLTAATEYYVRAYATNSEGTAYGENINFVTLEATPEEPEIPEEPEDPYNGHEYVDMGFPSGVKWATCNVGATLPTEYGEHYAWGEIETKEKYEMGNCTTYGKALDSISGNSEYDAASAKWGGNWRTPRLEDMYELVTKCEWIWAGNGFNVVSKINGNYIFLPAAGFMNTPAAIAGGTEGVLDQGRWGYYWTATPYDEKYTNKEACSLLLSSGGYQTEVGLRYNGFSIRPVID